VGKRIILVFDLRASGLIATGHVKKMIPSLEISSSHGHHRWFMDAPICVASCFRAAIETDIPLREGLTDPEELPSGQFPK
jgi:hypothetical protein